MYMNSTENVSGFTRYASYLQFWDEKYTLSLLRDNGFTSKFFTQDANGETRNQPLLEKIANTFAKRQMTTEVMEKDLKKILGQYKIDYKIDLTGTEEYPAFFFGVTASASMMTYTGAQCNVTGAPFEV